VRNVLLSMPIGILKMVYGSRLPDVDVSVHYVKGINSREALDVLSKERPETVVVYGCGLVGRRLCERFHNVLLNAHAGKLPEFRGMNNVEWSYLSESPLVGTVYFMASGIDAGDIVYEEELKKEENPKSIHEIRERAFDQVFGLFPKALRRMQEDDFRPAKQTEERTTRYVMHPFLRRMLEKTLRIDGS